MSMAPLIIHYVDLLYLTFPQLLESCLVLVERKAAEYKRALPIVRKFLSVFLIMSLKYIPEEKAQTLYPKK